MTDFSLPPLFDPLKSKRVWLNWKLEPRKGGTGYTKPPYQPNDPTQYAEPNNPAHFGTFDEHSRMLPKSAPMASAFLF
jgi:primase-polymerase (primpol)-like protein